MCCLRRSPFNRKNVKNLLKHPFVDQKILISNVDNMEDIYKQHQNKMKTSPFVKNKQFFNPAVQEEIILGDKVNSKDFITKPKEPLTPGKKSMKKPQNRISTEAKNNLRQKRMSVIEKPVKHVTSDVKKSKSIAPLKSPKSRQLWKDVDQLIQFKANKINLGKSPLSQLSKPQKNTKDVINKDMAEKKQPGCNSDDSIASEQHDFI